MWAKIGNNRIREIRTVKVLGITIDNELKFDEHLSNVCLEVNKKLTALMRIRKYLDFIKIRILFKGFFESQCKYCPFIWMVYNRSRNRRIYHLHERALKMVYNYKLTFKELSQKDRSFTIHHYNIQTLRIELHKLYHDLSQTIPNRYSYYFRSTFGFHIPQVRAVLKGSNSIRYYGPIIWSLVPEEIRHIDSLEKFKSKIRRWKSNDWI